MSNIHIDDFYKDTALILTRLFSQFPRRYALYVEDICGPDDPDEYGLHSDRFMACFSTMLWLAEEGYLRYENTIRQEAVDMAVLTHRAFVLLMSRSNLSLGDPEEDEPDDDLPPSVQASAMSHIAQLRKALKTGSSITIGQCSQYILTQFQSAQLSSPDT